MGTKRWFWLSIVLVLFAAITGTATRDVRALEPRMIERLSLSSAGEEGDWHSVEASVSADGRYVAFRSESTNLDPGDDPGFPDADIFVRDRVRNSTTLVSVGSAGQGGWDPVISADGRFVAFSARHLLAEYPPDHWDEIHVRDLEAGITTLVSISSDGEPDNHASGYPSISADGRYVAFMSHADNLVPDDTNGFPDIFVHDRVTAETRRVSVASDGTQSNGRSYAPAISADGSLIAFESDATNLDVGYGYRDVFVHEVATGITTQISQPMLPNPDPEGSHTPRLSPDGRYVLFTSNSVSLIPGGTLQRDHAYLYDRVTGTTTLESVAPDGTHANLHSLGADISADGRYVLYSSFASNLVAGDDNQLYDIFVRDRTTGAVARLSVDANGAQANGHSGEGQFTADAAHIVFVSYASNLVPGDTNDARDVFYADVAPDVPALPPTPTATPTLPSRYQYLPLIRHDETTGRARLSPR